MLRTVFSMPSKVFYSALARAILAGEAARSESDVDPIVARLRRTLGRNWRWLSPLARRYLKAFGADTRPTRAAVIAFLASDEGLKDAIYHRGKQIRIADWMREPDQMQPAPAAYNWPIPGITSVGGLADWIGITTDELMWFANLKSLQATVARDGRSAPGNHYHYHLLPKTAGGIRIIEAPKQRLKEIQNRILIGILSAIPVHPAVHGFRRGLSITTFAAPHVARRVVLRMDLRDFFPSLTRVRVQAMFRTAGYPEPVADLLGGLCTNAVPRGIFSPSNYGVDPTVMFEARQLYGFAHLPQGAPSSPALSNICTYRLDCRLAGLAEASGAVYTRYADDLAFSGPEEFERGAERFATHAAAIVLEEGFNVHHRKTRVMRSSVRQHLAGLVVNHHLNVDRRHLDRLKATLTNCVRHGPESQNREAHPAFRLHLEGRVGFIETVNPLRGARLREIFEQIQW